MKNKYRIMLYCISITVIIFLSASCSKTIYVPVESVKTEYRDKLLRDSIFLRDSILIKTINDTVWIEKYRYAYRDRIVRDSVFVNDTIRIPYPIIEYKEINKLKGWQNFLIWIGGIAVLIIAFKVIKKTY